MTARVVRAEFSGAHHPALTPATACRECGAKCGAVVVQCGEVGVPFMLHVPFMRTIICESEKRWLSSINDCGFFPRPMAKAKDRSQAAYSVLIAGTTADRMGPNADQVRVGRTARPCAAPENRNRTAGFGRAAAASCLRPARACGKPPGRGRQKKALPCHTGLRRGPQNFALGRLGHPTPGCPLVLPLCYVQSIQYGSAVDGDRCDAAILHYLQRTTWISSAITMPWILERLRR